MRYFTLIIIGKLSKICDSFDSFNWIYQNYPGLSIITIILFQQKFKQELTYIQNDFLYLNLMSVINTIRRFTLATMKLCGATRHINPAFSFTCIITLNLKTQRCSGRNIQYPTKQTGYF